MLKYNFQWTCTCSWSQGLAKQFRILQSSIWKTCKLLGRLGWNRNNIIYIEGGVPFFKIWKVCFENDPLYEPNQMPPSKKFYLFRKTVKNAKWWSKSNLPLSHCPDRKIFPLKKDFKKYFLMTWNKLSLSPLSWDLTETKNILKKYFDHSKTQQHI